MTKEQEELRNKVEKYKGESYGDSSFGFINAVIFGENLMEAEASEIIDEWHKKEIESAKQEVAREICERIDKANNRTLDDAWSGEVKREVEDLRKEYHL